MAESDTVTVSAQCLCKAHTFTALVPRTDLPLQASCCHCNSCRHLTGGLYTCNAPWPGSSEEIHASNLRKYRFTLTTTVLFCGTCSTPMFWHQQFVCQEEKLIIFTGALANSATSNFLKIVDHIFMADTIDGGASLWLRRPNEDGSIPRRWSATRDASEELDHNWPTTESLPGYQDRVGPVEIPIQCHCKGINLVLRRGDTDFAAMKREELPWFVEPKTHELLGGFDACNSCRSTVGVDVVNWTYAMLQHIEFFNSTTQSSDHGFPQTTKDLKDAVSARNRDPRFGTLAIYESSPDVQRYFCSQCSASAFYAVDDRQEMVDVAAGLLDSPSGARAEDFLLWGFGSDIGYKEDVVGGWRESLVKFVQDEALARFCRFLLSILTGTLSCYTAE